MIELPSAIAPSVSDRRLFSVRSGFLIAVAAGPVLFCDSQFPRPLRDFSWMTTSDWSLVEGIGRANFLGMLQLACTLILFRYSQSFAAASAISRFAFSCVTRKAGLHGLGKSFPIPPSVPG